MSASPSADSPPRVRGLGWREAGWVLTLAHVAERANLSLAADGSGGEEPVGRTTSDGDLAIMRAEGAAPPVPLRPAAAPSPGQPCAVAIVPDDSPRVSIVGGTVAAVADDGRFTVDLERGLSEDSTASGSPVVGPDGTVLGIVGPTATNRSVDAFGASAIERILERAAAPAITLSPSANAALGGAIAIATTPRQPSAGARRARGPDRRAHGDAPRRAPRERRQRGPHGRRRPPRPRRRPPPGAGPADTARDRRGRGPGARRAHAVLLHRHRERRRDRGVAARGHARGGRARPRPPRRRARGPPPPPARRSPDPARGCLRGAPLRRAGGLARRAEDRAPRRRRAAHARRAGGDLGPDPRRRRDGGGDRARRRRLVRPRRPDARGSSSSATAWACATT